MVGASLAGAAIKGQAERSAAGANASILESNAALAEMQAGDALARGEQAAGRERMRSGQLQSAQKTGYAASGVETSSGSVSDVIGSTAAVSELDAQIEKNNAAREAFGFKTRAAQFRGQARYTRAVGDQAFFTSMLGGVLGSASATRGLSVGGHGGLSDDWASGGGYEG